MWGTLVILELPDKLRQPVPTQRRRSPAVAEPRRTTLTGPGGSPERNARIRSMETSAVDGFLLTFLLKSCLPSAASGRPCVLCSTSLSAAIRIFARIREISQRSLLVNRSCQRHSGQSLRRPASQWGSTCSIPSRVCTKCAETPPRQKPRSAESRPRALIHLNCGSIRM